MAEWTVKVPTFDREGDPTVIEWDGHHPDNDDGMIVVNMDGKTMSFLANEVRAFVEMAIVGGFVQGFIGRDDE